ncbi:hypothetical protein [Sphingomonas sp.]|uniref:hypothetical protein n=1 Tax=Sphingomonas sp. TaxID=28214 RepID=UPI00344CE905
MRCFWDERQRAHTPAAEFFNGALHAAAEHPGRVDAILDCIGSTEAPADHGMEPLLRAHAHDYVQFLQTAHSDWRSAGRAGDAFPYTFPVIGRRPLELDRIDARLGRYGFDTSTPIGRGRGKPVTGAPRPRSPRCRRCSTASAAPSLCAARRDITPARIISAAIPT